MASIRTALLDDIPALIVLLKAMHDESPRYRAISFCEEKALASVRGALSSENCLVLVAEDEGKMFGVFAAIAVEHMFSKEMYSIDFLNYVTPEKRGIMTAIRFVSAYKDWAESLGIRRGEITIGVSTGKNTDRIAQLYRHAGFENSGVTLRLGEK